MNLLCHRSYEWMKQSSFPGGVECREVHATFFMRGGLQVGYLSQPLVAGLVAEFELGGGDEIAEGEAQAGVVEAVEAAVAGSDALDVAAIFAQGAFVIEVFTAVVGKAGYRDVGFDRPNGGTPGGQGRAGEGFEHQVVVGLEDSLMAQDHVSKRWRGG